ncbi:hypothetical protein [Herbiconiux sp. UC225_62]|uniref:hypothetical protein n=1 Tax=Herbiconiux sp. UC225_62 TaxID=3350168 RepID=UPI0036D322B3
MRSIGRATVPLRVVGVAGVVLGVLALLGALLLPHNMTCTNTGDCRTTNDLLFGVAMLGRIVGAPFAAAGSFALGLSLVTAAFRPAALSARDVDSDPRREATMNRDLDIPDAIPSVFAPARALWTFAIILFTVCAAAAVFVSLPLTQVAFGSSCDENGCTYSPLYTVIQVAGFLAPSMMIAALLIATLAIVASTINRHGGIRLGVQDASAIDRDDPDRRGGYRDPDAELDELLNSATDDLGRSRSRGPATWRGGDLTPFMRPSGHEQHGD